LSLESDVDDNVKRAAPLVRAFSDGAMDLGVCALQSFSAKALRWRRMFSSLIV
jgi:hypothetical protein